MNIGFGELLLILLIAFVVVGPKDLPKIGRALGKAVRQMRGLYASVKKEMDLDTELTGIKQQIKPTLSVAEDLSEVRQEIEKIQRLTK